MTALTMVTLTIAPAKPITPPAAIKPQITTARHASTPLLLNGATKCQTNNAVKLYHYRALGSVLYLVERQNLTMRTQMRRFTRLTSGFSKKLENLKAAVSLHFTHYNFVRLHRGLRVTPAMAASVSERLWMLVKLVEQTSR